mgnify:CR=1
MEQNSQASLKRNNEHEWRKMSSEADQVIILTIYKDWRTFHSVRMQTNRG